MIVDRYTLVTFADARFKVSKNRVEFEQMRKSAGVGDVVDGYDFYVLPPHRSPVNIPANAAKAINSDPGCHSIFLHHKSDVAIPRFSTSLGTQPKTRSRHKQDFTQDPLLPHKRSR